MSADILQLSSLSSPVEIVDQVLSYAVRVKASDILFEPQEQQVAVRLRVDGILNTFGQMDRGSYAQVLTRVKVLGNMDVTENRKPQESKIRFEVDAHPYVCRVAVVSTNFGQLAVLRLLDAPEFTNFTDLGMNNDMAMRVQKNISGRYGLFLVAGPTGSGKTTTVHSALQLLNNGEVNIMTIEDPVEYVMPGINQIEVGPNVGLDFASGLRMILRLNPDIVFVGEIRDSETARIAVQASLTGHLVISTIHSRNSIGALFRLVDLGIDRAMINYAVRGIASQRLVRRVCDRCRKSNLPTDEEATLLVSEGITNVAALSSAVGCDWCTNTGYKGRAGIFEFLELTDPVRKLVMSGASESLFQDELEKIGFVDMAHQGVQLLSSGATSLKEYLRTMYDAV